MSTKTFKTGSAKTAQSTSRNDVIATRSAAKGKQSHFVRSSKKSLVLFFFLLTSVFCILSLSGCGGGGGGDAVTTTPPTPTTAKVSGTAEVPSGVQTAKAGGFFNFVRNLFVSEASAVADKKALSGATVTMNVLNKNGTLVELSTVPKAVTDEKGNFTLTEVPEGDNYVIEAKLVTPQGKTVKIYDITPVTSADIGQTKTGTTCDVEGTMALQSVKDLVENTGKDLKDIDKFQVENIEKEVDETIAAEEAKETDNDPNTNPVIDFDSDAFMSADETTLAQELTDLQGAYAELKAELEEILKNGTIAGEIKNSSGTALSGVTITISGGGLTSAVTTTTNSSGQYSYSVGSSTTAYTVTATLSGYQDSSANVTVTAATVALGNFTMTAVTTTTTTTTTTTYAYNCADYFPLNTGIRGSTIIRVLTR